MAKPNIKWNFPLVASSTSPGANPGDPDVSNKIEASFSYVGGRTDTLFSGVYIRESLPGLVAILVLNGLD